MQQSVTSQAPSFEAPVCHVCKRQDESLRIVSLPFVFSVVFMTFQRAFAGIYCRKHRRLYLALASLITATAGWLGIPFGFVLTPLTLYKLASGGSSDPHANAMLQVALANKKLLTGDTRGAIRCLEESLRFEDTPEIRQRLSDAYRAAPAEVLTGSGGMLKQTAGVLGVFLVCLLAGLAVGLFEAVLGYAISRLFENSSSIFVVILSWIPLVLVTFFGILWVRSAVGAALARGRIVSSGLALALAVSAALLAFYSIAEAESFIGNRFRIFTAFAFSSVDGLFFLRSLATSGGLYYIVNSYNFDDLAGVIYIVILLAAFGLCLLVTIRSALQVSRWQRRISEVQDATAAGVEHGSPWAWGTLAGLLTGGLALALILYPGRLVNVEAALIHFERGQEATNQYDRNGAMQEFRQASALWPDSVITHAAMSNGFMYLGDFDGALTELQAAEEIDPNGLVTNMYLGAVRYRRGEFDEAIQAMKKVTAAQPDLPEPHAMLTLLYYDADRLELVQAELDRAIALSQESAAANSFLSSYYARTRDLNSAEEYMLKAIQLGNDPSDYVKLSDIYSIQKKPDQALKVLDEAERLGADAVEVALSRARQATQKRDLPGAESAVLKGLETQPDNPDLLSELSFIYLLRGRVEEAVQQAEASIRHNPYDAGSYVELAYAYHAQGRLPDATAAARKALTLMPMYDRTHYILGLSYAESGMTEDGIKELETFLDLYYEREYVNADRQKALEMLEQLK